MHLVAFSFLIFFVLPTWGQKIKTQFLRKGTGFTINANDEVAINYRLWLKSGELIEDLRTIKLVMDQSKILPGVYQGLIDSHRGDHFFLFVPAELGYGSKKEGLIPAGSDLKYEIEIIEVNKKETQGAGL